MKVRVTTNAKSFSISKANGKITVRLKSKPHDNEANNELVRELSRHFRKKVMIARGLKSREKEIHVQGLSDEQAAALIP